MQDERLGEASTHSQLMNPAQWIFATIGVFLCIGLWLNFHQSQQFSKEQQSSIVRGYKNRAVICDMIKGLGITEPEPCADPAIQPYRDNTIHNSSTAGARSSLATKALVCMLLQHEHLKDPSFIYPAEACGQ